MLLGFKRQFGMAVWDGSKRHTIRAKRVIRPRLGETCYCYIDPRQKTMAKLGEWTCSKVDEITIGLVLKRGTDYGFTLRIWINADELTVDEVRMLLYRDGFRAEGDPIQQAVEFWKTRLRSNNNRWVGDLIHWQWSEESRAPLPAQLAGDR